MRSQYFLILLLASLHVRAAPIFDGYKSFYESFPDGLFINVEGAVAAKDNVVLLGGKKINLLKGTAFQDEKIFTGDIGASPSLYEEKNFFCIEGTDATSGTATRHMSVYLIYRRTGDVYKLPSLFASCLGIRKNKKGQPKFFKASLINYRSAYEADGVNFTEYKISDRKFEKTEKEIITKFIEPENFYKFEIEHRK